jgi:hypothetical protein
MTGLGIAAGAGGAFEALGNYLGGGERRKLEALMREISTWKFGKGKELYNQLKAMYDKGTTIAPGKRASMIGKNQQAMQGTFRRIMAALGNRGDLRNPVMQKIFSQTYMPMEADFSNKLDMFDMDKIAQLRSNLLRTTWG